jgi:hypothetical protein
LVSGQRPTAAREQPEAVVQTGGRAVDTESDDPRGGEVDRERDPVEASANGDRRRRDATLGNVPWLRGMARDTKTLTAPWLKTSSMSWLSSAGTSSGDTR